MLYGVDAMELAVAGSGVALMGMVAFLATYLPVRKAARRDLVAVLRSD
jgi:ABC-type antimicrobial peptide transport system permease subunit